MSTWVDCQTLELNLDLPLAERYLPHQSVLRAAADDLLVAMKKELPNGLERLAHLIDLRTLGKFRGEAKAQARVMGGDWRDLMIAGAAYDLTLAYFGCSTIAAATEDGPVLARNMDWWPERPLARHSYQFRSLRRGAAVTTIAGWPGALGLVTGMSAKGFALAMNAVGDGVGLHRMGYPVMLHLRRVVDECQSFDDAVKRVASQALAAPCLVTIVGTRNHQRVCIERMPTTANLRWAEGDAPLLTTNHFRYEERTNQLGGDALQSTSCGRLRGMEDLLPTSASALSDEHLLFVLSDQRVKLGITAQHIVMRPRENRMRLCVPAALAGLQEP
ncbi:C45 family autoproteolytic acyltransferase/hydolase [Aeoliella sp. SH292]|uniref:C45 family autoproteolytic acyltransferase/hydolase n=1 Tax=Aeoliella sp. SH292 TaxID=3454464 RepID=UPI003F98C5BC